MPRLEAVVKTIDKNCNFSNWMKGDCTAATQFFIFCDIFHSEIHSCSSPIVVPRRGGIWQRWHLRGSVLCNSDGGGHSRQSIGTCYSTQSLQGSQCHQHVYLQSVCGWPTHLTHLHTFQGEFMLWAGIHYWYRNKDRCLPKSVIHVK